MVTSILFSCSRGFVVSVVKDLGLPVKFIGVGEKIQDLRDFQPEVMFIHSFDHSLARCVLTLCNECISPVVFLGLCRCAIRKF